MDSKIHKLPNAKLNSPEPNQQLIDLLRRALAYAESGEARAGAVALVLDRPDGTYFFTSYQQNPNQTIELLYGISSLKARYEREIKLDAAP